MTKEDNIKKIIEKVDNELSKKEQMYILGVVDGIALSKTLNKGEKDE